MKSNEFKMSNSIPIGSLLDSTSKGDCKSNELKMSSSIPIGSLLDSASEGDSKSNELKCLIVYLSVVYSTAPAKVTVKVTN